MHYHTALITGASAGIGKAIAEAAAQQKIKLILMARRAERLTELQQQLAPLTQCHIIACDINDQAQVTKELGALPAAFAEVDVLINNAGLALGSASAQASQWSDWQTMIDTNCTALAFLIQQLLPAMVERDRGHIINLGSVAGSYPYPGGNIYAASKAFVEQLTLNLKADLFGTAVRITNIEPGMVGGGSEFSLVRNRGNEAAANKVRQGLRALEPIDIANSVLWALNQPTHVNVNRIELMAVAQAPGRMAYNRES